MEQSDKEKGQLAQQTKSREEIMAERKAKKAEKANKKTGGGGEKPEKPAGGPKQQNTKAPPAGPKQPKEKPPPAEKQSKHQADPVKAAPINLEGIADALARLSLEPHSALKPVSDNKQVHFDLNTKVIALSLDDPVAPPADVIEPEWTEPDDLYIHPAFITLFTRCERGEISHIDELCKSFLIALKLFVQQWGADEENYTISRTSMMATELELSLRTQLNYLTKNGRWPLPFAVGNILRLFKKYLKKIEEQEAENKTRGLVSREAYDELFDCVVSWLEDTENNFFRKAVDRIIFFTIEKFQITKKVLVFDWCPLINEILIAACDSKSRHLREIVVIDQEVNGRGIRHFDTLREKDVRLAYGDLQAISAALEGCSMALFGCSAVLSNGSVAITKGAMMIALACEAARVPVAVVSQTFKFVDKVLSHGRVSLLGREDMEIVPSQLAPMIITEIGAVPSTSAPAILRAKSLENTE